MADPKDTLIILDRLEALGFDNAAFQALHHFREGARPTTIARHRAYCEKTARFEEVSENERTQRRLKLVLVAYVLGGFSTRAALAGLAEAAFAEIPTAAASVRAPDRLTLPDVPGAAMRYMINVDLETKNVTGGRGVDCRS